MNNSSTTWVVIIIAVLLLIGGLWWWSTQPATPVVPATNQPVATTTPSGAQPIVVESRTSSTVAAIVAELSGVSEFQSLFLSTGVSTAVTGKGPFTVFVPTDAGFSLITKGTITGMTAAQKKRLVQYHVVAGRAVDIDEIDNGTIQALSKDALNFKASSGTSMVQVNSSVALRAYKASNGIVYVINQPLLPPTAN